MSNIGLAAMATTLNKSGYGLCLQGACSLIGVTEELKNTGRITNGASGAKNSL